MRAPVHSDRTAADSSLDGHDLRSGGNVMNRVIQTRCLNLACRHAMIEAVSACNDIH